MSAFMARSVQILFEVSLGWVMTPGSIFCSFASCLDRIRRLWYMFTLSCPLFVQRFVYRVEAGHRDQANRA